MKPALKLKWNKEAAIEFENIIDFLIEHNPNAAQQLYNTIQTKTKQLLDHPKMYRIGRVSNTREMPVKPSYIVVYIENEETIEILRVLHSRMNYVA